MSVLCFSSDPPPNPPPARADEVGAPIGAYPAPSVVELSGNRFAEKSKLDETEYERPSLDAGFPSSRGSSSSTRDSRREEEMLGLEETFPEPPAPSCDTLELARDASSSESRVCAKVPGLPGIASRGFSFFVGCGRGEGVSFDVPASLGGLGGKEVL